MSNTGILVDAYTWIEIFKDTLWGKRALVIIEKNPSVFISVLTLYELQYRLEEIYGKEIAASHIETIHTHTEVILVDNQIALIAGSIKCEQKRKKNTMSAVDCMILATAQVFNLKVLTGDKHFNGLEELLPV